MLLKILFSIATLAAQANGTCSKPMENLIIVNFSSSKLTVYVNNKKLGAVPKETQKNFKKTLPVGDVKVTITNTAKVLLREESYTIVSQGKQTCKNNKAIIIN